MSTTFLSPFPYVSHDHACAILYQMFALEAQVFP